MSRATARPIARQPATPEAPDLHCDVLDALLGGWCLAAVVPLVLDAVERDPLASVGRFRGDLLRGLMEVPNGFWRRFPLLSDRYRAAIRAGAAVRRALAVDERMEFWSELRWRAGGREGERARGREGERNCETAKESGPGGAADQPFRPSALQPFSPPALSPPLCPSGFPLRQASVFPTNVPALLRPRRGPGKTILISR